jgi:quercetin dioxygenase-like cupin family protein
MTSDPTESNSDHYRVVFENDRVRVLQYTDEPGDSTTPHSHPDSVMIAESDIHRRLVMGDKEREVQIPAGTVTWLAAQEHSGHNIGSTPTRAYFIELKEPRPGGAVDEEVALGPQL